MKETFLRQRCNFKVTMVAFYSKLTDQLLEWPGKIVKVYKTCDCHGHPSHHGHEVCFPLAVHVDAQREITPAGITERCRDDGSPG